MNERARNRRRRGHIAALTTTSLLLAGAAPAAAPPAAAPVPAAPAPRWGQAWDTGYGFLVAAISRGPFGQNVAAVFPWEALEKCVTAKLVFDPAKGDRFDAVHSIDLGVPEGKRVAVTREVLGKPPVRTGCLGKALLSSKPPADPPGLARVSFVLVPRETLLEAPRTVEVVSGPRPTDPPALAETIRTVATACLSAAPPKAPARTTGKLLLTVATADANILSVKKVTGKVASKPAVDCLKERLPAPPAPAPAPASAAPKPKPALVTYTLRVTAGGSLLVDDPINIKDVLPAVPAAP